VKEPILASAQLRVLGVVKDSVEPGLRAVRDKVVGSEIAGSLKLPVGALMSTRAAGDKVNDVAAKADVVVVFTAKANEPPEYIGVAEAGTVPSATSTRANPAAVKEKYFLITPASFHFWALTGAIHR
jgi:hypothetical protein